MFYSYLCKLNDGAMAVQSVGTATVTLPGVDQSKLCVKPNTRSMALRER